jgi:hypothetical protein
LSRDDFFKNRHGISPASATVRSKGICEHAARPGEENFGRAGISARNN